MAAIVPVKPGATRLLDIGGSHGLYGGLIARTHPPLRSQVLDLPPAVEQARLLAAAEGLDDVVSHQAGNVLTDDLGEGWDVVFMENVLHHHYTPGQIADLLARVAPPRRQGPPWPSTNAGFDDVQIQAMPLTGAIAVISGRTTAQ